MQDAMNGIGTPYRVLFEPSGVSCEATEGETLLHTAHANGIALRSDCGGGGACGKCKLFVFPLENASAPSPKELEVLSPDELAQGMRLACQSRPSGPLTATVPAYSLDAGTAVGKTGVKGRFPVQPAVERILLKGGPPPEDGPRDLAASLAEKGREIGKAVAFKENPSLQDLSRPFAYEGDITLVSHIERGVTAVLPGHRRRSLGIAIDIGTTTLAAYLCDLTEGAVLTSEASANPQRRFGEDVISRIAFADNQPDGLDILHEMVVEELNRLIRRCLATAKAEKEDVDEVSVVGNPTMEQLFASIHPHSLGRAPYLPVSLAPAPLRAGEVGLDLHPAANVYLFPVISGFVGGDTLAVILADRPHEREEISLIVDIGTNGEVVLGNRRGLFVTSCATGPAFEGAQIACGMRAVAGAIHRVAIDPSTCSVKWDLIGGTDREKPRGICGSGIIDAVAEMGRAGLLLSSGRMREGMPGVVTDGKGIGREFVLVSKSESVAGRNISIALSDIRQVQLAKAALYSGIALLMQKAGIDRIDRMLLTGAFGARFNWKNAMSIGMLPQIQTSASTVENAAGVGAVMALLDHARRKEASDLAQRIQVLELAGDPDFQTVFPMSMTFPFGE